MTTEYYIHKMLGEANPTFSSITHKELQTILLAKYGWVYEPDYHTFSYYKNGEKLYVNSRKLSVMAAFYRFFGNL